MPRIQDTAEEKLNSRRVWVGYDWQQLRAAYVQEFPLCQHCEQEGKIVPVEHVDHIIPFKGRHDPKRLEWSNLQSLCVPCHNKKTRGYDG